MGHHRSTAQQQVTLPSYRTDNSVKNHFYSRLRRALRKLNKVITVDYSKDLKEFKPNILYRIVEVAEEKFKNNPAY